MRLFYRRFHLFDWLYIKKFHRRRDQHSSPKKLRSAIRRKMIKGSTKSKMINVQIVRLFCVGLFIVDGYYDVYVWEGWMPEDDDDVRTGSGRQRWDKDRRLAMETALNYAKGLFSSNLCIICFAKMFFIWR